MRILLIAPFNPGPRRGSFFYGIQNYLANGFTRNGHLVVTLDERPRIKQALGIRRIGQRLMHGRVLETVRELRPDLICMHNSVLTGAHTVQQVRQELPDCRVATVWHDPLGASGKDRFCELLETSDFGFATTGGARLAAFAGKCPVAFIPNPIDVSVHNLTAYAARDKTADVFCAFRKGGKTDRFGLIDDLQRLKPNLRYAIYGRNKQNLIYGDAYYRVLDQAKVGLNINRYEGDLYASDRLAQYLGNGLLVASRRCSGYAQYFGDDEMIFFDGAEDLGEQIERVVADDRRWRLMAERGRAKALALMSETRVADFMVRMTLGLGPSKDWPFPNHIFLNPSEATPEPSQRSARPGAPAN
jgi:Glycosyl transferases group 1